VRVMLVEDARLVRAGMARLLADADIEVVAQSPHDSR
jgi:DNA-binding NarL/FixJ family response regulator